jgi:hypothetical protein
MNLRRIQLEDLILEIKEVMDRFFKREIFLMRFMNENKVLGHFIMRKKSLLDFVESNIKSSILQTLVLKVTDILNISTEQIDSWMIMIDKDHSIVMIIIR